jgi:hypothetical protein
MEYDILVEDYIETLYVCEEFQYLDESFKEFFSKLTPPKMKQILSKTYEKAASKDLQGFLNLAKKFGLDINKIKPKDIKNVANQLPEEIQKGAEFSRRVIRNSIPKASKSGVNAASYFVAVLAKYKSQKTANYMGSLKTELKGFVGKVQQFYEEAEEKASQAGERVLPEDIADMAIAIGTVVALSALTVMAVLATYAILQVVVWFVIIAVGVALMRWAMAAGTY